ncbi:hypothetical protein AMR42_14310 [Limnothrix sp. PR1529]|uniref:hypothetical protein n=1 Tax=Limnothrix sp. PR1529 TaxID=1704291 RepID=UPI00081E206B|nr:hypothetical protein [Limnothrix sp. PR1529]OCQ94042.1 hypothetical protein BCR12_05875 [Limnothrix sp. P13C2]PIB07296.1 hypothetical protein AMR42_14310 [Limnothrix sp. PR1529]
MYTQHPPQNVTYKTVMAPNPTEALPRRLTIQDAPSLLDSLLPKSKTDLASRVLITLASGHISGLLLRLLPVSPVAIALTLTVVIVATLSLWCVARYAPQSNAVVAAIVAIYGVGFILTWVA